MNTKLVLSKLFFVFLGFTAALFLFEGTKPSHLSPVQAAPTAAAEQPDIDKIIRLEIGGIVAEEFEKYASNTGLTSEGQALVRELAKKRTIEVLTQETWRQLRSTHKVKTVNINYNASETTSPVAMSADGQTLAVSGSEGILVSRDGGNTWDKVVED